MKIKLSLTQKVSLKIIFMFTCAMAISLIPQYYPNFFGDFKCAGNTINYDIKDKYDNFVIEGCDIGTTHNPKLHWGYRHDLFFLMGIALFIVQIWDLCLVISKHEKDK